VLLNPYMAVINGAAIGAGLDMASMCDLRFASDTTPFSTGYLTIGMGPGDGGCFYFPRINGLSKSLELLWTGETFNSQDALQMGYINKVIPSKDLQAVAMEFALSLCSGPPIAIQNAKRLVYSDLNQTVYDALEQADNAKSIVLSTKEAREGINAFLEKRKPNYRCIVTSYTL
jgi:enoyl-CoA hydratase/carnithine racemase